MRTTVEDVEVDTFSSGDLDTLSTKSVDSQDEDLDYFKSLAESD
jgi:hypothetical protein